MRYDVARKLQRNAELRQYAKEHPELALKEIGDKFGISRQRVFQLLNPPNHKDELIKRRVIHNG